MNDWRVASIVGSIRVIAPHVGRIFKSVQHICMLVLFMDGMRVLLTFEFQRPEGKISKSVTLIRPPKKPHIGGGALTSFLWKLRALCETLGERSRPGWAGIRTSGG